MVIGQAEVLAFRFLGGAQAMAGRFQTRIGLGEFAQGKDQPPQDLLGQVVEEIALVLALIKAAQKLVAAPAIARHGQGIGGLARANPGVVARGDAANGPLLGRPGQHRPKLHLPVAAGAGQGRHPGAIALHQKLDDLGLERGPGIDHVVGDTQLLADGGRIHQPFGATRPLAAHEPEGEALHLPASLHQQGRRQGAIHPPREAHRHPLLARPGPQPLDRRRPGRSGRGGRTGRRGLGGSGKTGHNRGTAALGQADRELVPSWNWAGPVGVRPLPLLPPRAWHPSGSQTPGKPA